MKLLNRNFFFVFCIALTSRVMGNSSDYQLSFLSVEDGLSQNEVTSIQQDQYGFMWFGTRGGLNRYDGYEFKHFEPSIFDSASITNTSIECLLLNSANEILIGLRSGGPSKYSCSKETFTTIDKAIRQGLNRVVSFYQDYQNNLWIGSWNNGILCIKNDTVLHFNEPGQVRSIVETEDGTIWFGSTSGLKYLRHGETSIHTYSYGSITSIAVDKNNSCIWTLGWTESLKKINYKTFEQKEYKNNRNTKFKNFSLLNHSNGALWIGTWGNGLYQFNKAEEKFIKVDIYPGPDKGSLVDYNVIRTIFEDKIGDIWLGTHAGIVRLSSRNKFHVLNRISSSNNGIHVSSVFAEDDGRIWVGTNGNGLFYSDDQRNFTMVTSRQGLRFRDQDDLVVKTIRKGIDGRIWVSLESGLHFIDQSNSLSPKLVALSEIIDCEYFDKVKKVLDLHFNEDELWLATQQNGIYLFKRNGTRYTLVRNYSAQNEKGFIGDNRVTAFKEDFQGNLWCATYKGLYKFNASDSLFISLLDLGVESPLACDIVLTLEVDEDGIVWFGTPCGLGRLECSKKDDYTVRAFNKQDGLADDYVNGIVAGGNGSIWLSTNAGISKFDPRSHQFINFDKVDGIGDASYSEGACFKDNSGNIYFGGYTSLTFFNPDQIIVNNYDAPLVISGFTILNKEVKVSAEGSILSNNINEVKHLEFTHNQMEFSFKIASLDYKAPEKNQYAYSLRGYDNSWVNVGNQRRISFKNLKPDEYRLLLKGTNSNGLWSDEIKELKITILPAPWKTAYAIVGYIILILLVVILIIRTAIRQERLQNTIEVERIQNKQIKEINDYKLSFFTNISHEFRTPLTLILGPVKELMNKTFSELKPDYLYERLQLIGHNSNRLYSLVNQLLEFRKLESGKTKLLVTKCDLKDLIEENCIPFKVLAKSQSVRFNMNFHVNETTAYLDVERISIVLTNLLSNAFKHVIKEGAVRVELEDDTHYYQIKVKNDGKSIPKSEQKYLFDRFYQVKGVSSTGSSGIGLQLVKSFTELHGGKVSVMSEEKMPVVFTISLKKGRQHFSDDEIVEGRETNTILSEPEFLVGKTRANKKKDGETILIVEDNIEVREYLVSFLSQYYSTLEASDGYEGFEKAIQHKPALILSDVMMPQMDGYELCEKVKTSDIIGDIPVVLLTAKGSDSEYLFGKQKGADLYIKKPFVPEILLEEIKQLLASRLLLKEKYSRKLVLEAGKEEITSDEEIFLKDALKIVEMNMNNVDFNPDVLASGLAMSPSSFYRKIRKTTNLTPAGFIKSIKLKKAAQLLADTNLTVSEIIERTGYIDVRSFRKNFNDQFGLNPTDFRNQHK